MGNTTLDILDPNTDITSSVSKRIIADALREVGSKEIIYEPDGRKMSYSSALARMLWQATVDGVVYFSDGTTLSTADDPKLWMETVKFLAAHLDGPVNASTNFANVNVFKVYRNIDSDRI